MLHKGMEIKMKKYAFGVDVGGTTCKMGLFKTEGTLLEKWEIPTDTTNRGENILKDIAKAVQEKIAEQGISADEVQPELSIPFSEPVIVAPKRCISP